MIEQILAHAQRRAELHRTDTDLDDVLSSVLEDLDPTLDARSATVTAGALPTLPADGQQLYSVLLNLVSNAVKYSRPGVAPVIEVSAGADRRSWRLSVRDNGIGISAADRERVFGLFNRVETSVDGSGIGLATVKRIIEAHGGSIGVTALDRARAVRAAGGGLPTATATAAGPVGRPRRGTLRRVPAPGRRGSPAPRGPGSPAASGSGRRTAARPPGPRRRR